MPSGEASLPSTIDEVLAAEANKALIRGGFYLGICGVSAAALITSTSLLGVTRGLWGPCAASLMGGLWGFFVSALARAGKVKGVVVHLVFVPFVSLPTFLFVFSHFTLPAGAATYLTGPFSLLYLVLIAATGFMFNARLSIVASLVAAAGYGLSTVLALPHLAEISAPDPIALQDLAAPALFAFRASILLMGGAVMAGLAKATRKHIERVREEEQKKERVARLFGQYVSPEVAARIVADRSHEAGEKRSVAVLFSDLRGFTSFSERATPEELVRRLNDYFDAMVECITRNGGVVDKFIGDAVMAVFGGVLPLERPCDAAVAAAQAMRGRLAELNRRWAAEGLAPLENGVGVHFGEVLQGSIGSRDRKDFTVIGDAVNTASRVEGLTKDTPQRVVVTREVYDRLGEPAKAACVALGRTRVKGKAEEVEIFGVPDPGPAPERAASS